jgi:hypothetical protein
MTGCLTLRPSGSPIGRDGVPPCFTEVVAYARFGDDSDVYVFSTGRSLLCMRCALGPDFTAKSTAVMVAHLGDHRGAGHKVPEDAISDLLERQEENDAEFSQPD